MKKFKRVLAIAGVCIIVCLYLASFVSAFFTASSETAWKLFRAAFASTIFVPVFLYIVIWLHGVLEKYRFKGEDFGKEDKIGEDFGKEDKKGEDFGKKEEEGKEEEA